MMMENLKRRINKRTDYRQRTALIRSGKHRLVVRRSLNSFSIQFISYEQKGDKTIVGINSRGLKKLGWNGHTGNIPSGYLAGLMAGVAAKKAGINEAVLDMGLQIATKGNSVFAVAKGVVDAGVKVPLSNDVVPSKERLSGAHVKNKATVAEFEAVKKKILGK